MERDHIGFIADCTFSSITVSKFTTYNWTIGPKILCSKDKVTKEFKNHKRVLKMGGNLLD